MVGPRLIKKKKHVQLLLFLFFIHFISPIKDGKHNFYAPTYHLNANFTATTLILSTFLSSGI